MKSTKIKKPKKKSNKDFEMFMALLEIQDKHKKAIEQRQFRFAVYGFIYGFLLSIFTGLTFTPVGLLGTVATTLAGYILGGMNG